MLKFWLFVVNYNAQSFYLSVEFVFFWCAEMFFHFHPDNIVYSLSKIKRMKKKKIVPKLKTPARSFSSG